MRWLKKHPGCPIIVVTEGEKKAASAVKHGIPCIGLGGVDSWRSRTIILPKDVELTAGKKAIRARLPSSDTSIPELHLLANGFGSFIDAVIQHNLTPVVVFDSDRGGTLKADVQRAATMLAYEIRHLGIPSSRIRQVILPDVSGLPEGGKTGLDDFLQSKGAEPFIEALQDAYNDPTKFPRHPNPKGFISVQLNSAMSRKDCQQVASVILAELDAAGMRFREAHTGAPYYYDRLTFRLVPAQLLGHDGSVMHETKFGTLLYQKFGLSAVDRSTLTWLASQFTGEEPIKEVTPRRVRTLITEYDDPTNPHGIAIQTSDSTFIAVSPDPSKPVKLHTNGDLNLLFEQDQVEPVDVDRVLEYFENFNAEEGTLHPWWMDILHDTNLGKTVESPDSPEGARMRQYACLLYYISPFLQRWRGVQLPVEITVGEAGSGKSSLYSMRLQILTGRPQLRNLPNDVRDWYASISNAGGLHVTDNVHFSKRDLKQKLSDEICRIITEPNPTVEMRKLFTTADVARVPVDVTFAFTAVQQPFQNSDLFSRAAIFETASLGKPPEGDWVSKKIDEYGGREAWIAHHLVFLHRFLRATSSEESGWGSEFKTSNRLANLEQALFFAGKVLDIDSSFLKVTIKEVQSNALTEADWTMQGMKLFVDDYRLNTPSGKFTARDICDWLLAYEDGDFANNVQLSSARKLGRYIKSHFSVLASTLGIVMGSVQGNLQYYRLDPRWRPATEQAMAAMEVQRQSAAMVAQKI
jgi:hypothetical protein